MQEVIENKDENYVGLWQMIPKNAFLYFPEGTISINQQGEEIKVGSGEK